METIWIYFNSRVEIEIALMSSAYISCRLQNLKLHKQGTKKYGKEKNLIQSVISRLVGLRGVRVDREQFKK